MRSSKKFLRSALAIVLAFVLSFSSLTPSYAATKLSISKTKVTLNEGKSLTLKASGGPSTSYKWTTSSSKKVSIKVSSDKKKATIKAKAAGTVTITLKSGSKKKTCKITVKHPYDKGKVTQSATCVSKGTKTYTCTYCKKKKTSSIAMNPKNHVGKVTTKTTAPTCTQKGKTVKTCFSCKAVISTTYKNATGHQIVQEHKDPTFEEDGYDMSICSKCSTIISKTVIPKRIKCNVHTWGEGVVTKERPCDDYATKTTMCTVCGFTESETIPSEPDHPYAEVTRNNQTCVADGSVFYRCAVCGEEKTEILKADGRSHSNTVTVNQKDATCTEAGYSGDQVCKDCNSLATAGETIPATGHTETIINEKKADCLSEGYTGDVICAVCQEPLRKGMVTDIGDHSWDEGTIIKEATEEEEGLQSFTCLVCGETKEEILPKLEHVHDYQAVVTAPTCTESGHTTYTCKCGAEYTSDYVDATGHITSIQDTKEATCTEAGFTGNEVCDICGEIILEGMEIPMLSHNYITETKVPTKNSKGYKKTYCTLCGDVKSLVESDPLDSSVAAYYTVQNGKVVDVISGKELSGASVDGDYFSGGTITLPSALSNFTLHMVLDYNESSSKGIISNITYTSNSGKYESCDNVFRLHELTDTANRGKLVMPWVADSWNTGYVMTIPIALYAHVSANWEYLPQGDSFWSFSMDSDNGLLTARIDGASATMKMKTYENDQKQTVYVDKKLPASFKLTADHKIKELVVYKRAFTADEQASAYAYTGITPGEAATNVVVDGLTGLGSSLFVKREFGGLVEVQESETAAGTYTVDAGNGRTTSYTISDYVQPVNGIDNSKYESVHITNEPAEMEVGKQYPLSAYPYPFYIKGADGNGKADEFDINWTSSDPSVVTVIDGLLVAKRAGTVQITANLIGTNISDTVTITVKEKNTGAGKTWNVPSGYVSKNGYSFSDTNYESTTHAIYDAIDEAAANGYSRIVFPAQNFYAVPLKNNDGTAYTYYVPSNMTIEFPEGSVFYMMDNELSRSKMIYYFNFGVTNSDYTGSCENSHLVMDTYYGERYQTSRAENDFGAENRFVNMGRKAINCSVEIKHANYTAGVFIAVDGTSNVNKNSGVMKYGDFAKGRLNDQGTIEANEHWISTKNYITVPNHGKDGYFLSADGQDNYYGKYWGGCSARLYDILWFDSNKKTIQVDRFEGRGGYYKIPSEAAYFKVSLQQKELPTPGSGETSDSPWIALHDDGSAKNCEIKNTEVINSAVGVFSLVGESDGLWVHDNYTDTSGKKPSYERTGDIEDGVTASRNTVINNNWFYGYFATPSGVNNFVHTNYFTYYNTFSGEEEMTHILNNTIWQIQISEKVQAHVYYNTMYKAYVDSINKSIGHVYQQNNNSGKSINLY